VAGRIARRDETMHGLAVAALMALGAAISMFATPGAARWTQISTIVIFAPCAILGGFLRSLFSGPSALSE
jgi:hypothetical protein